jgi:ParB-like chromosome segregation protein Spo0J
MFAGPEGETGGASDEALKEQAEAKALRESKRIGKDLYSNIISGILEGNITGKNGITDVIAKELAPLVTPKAIFDRTRELNDLAKQLRDTLGLGSEKSKEFSQAIADNAGRFVEYGFDVQDVVETYGNLFKTFNTNVTVSDEELLQLKATASVTAQSVDKLASSFRGVGIGINEVGDRMLEVTNIAKDAGVSVSAVAAGVVTNLDKMNIYNFEGGTKGLAKMSAQAARLGIDMGKIFTVVDKVFNPEGAIELAAGLQRLGVSTNALLDPLRLMDLSQNDPTELQNQIVNMSKEFVRFNKELGQFEIMPGEKRRLNEIGKELGMNNGELQKMALNAANLDFKMKQIKFPSSIASKEDRELIATLATVNKEGIAEVKVKKMDEQGKFTGEYELKAVESLTDEQIKALKEQQSHGLTMEELQKESLTEEKRTNYLLESMLTALAYGEAGSAPMMDLYDLSTKSVREAVFKEKGREGGLVGEEFRSSKQYRKTIDGAYNEIKPELVAFGSEVFTMLKENAKDILTNAGIPTSAPEILTMAGNQIKDWWKNLDLTSMTSMIPGMGGSTNDPLTNYNQKISEVINNKVESTNINNNNLNKVEFTPLTIDEKLKVDINVVLDPDSKNQALSTLMTQALELFFQGGDNKTNVNMVKKSLEDDKTFQGIFKSVIETQKLVSAPGKT